MELNLNAVLNEYQQLLASMTLRAVIAESLVSQYKLREQEAAVAASLPSADQD